MTVRIRVREFQSIEDAEIEVTGLTVITGQNNSGKSAMVRAMFGAFTNARGSKFVRQGKDHCTVDITFADGRSLTWEKGDKVNRYVVDGKTLDKVGQAVPPEVEALGVVPITAAGRELWPQFAQQFTGQVFLLDQPGSVLAESIADVARVGVLNEALRASQSDRRGLSSELKVRQSDVLRLEVLESSFAGLDTVEVLAGEAEVLRTEVLRQTTLLGEAKGFHDDYGEHAAVVTELLPVRDVTVPEGLEGLHEALTELDCLRELSAKMVAAVRVRSVLAPLADMNLPDESVTQRMVRVADALSLLSGMRDQMAPLRELVADTLDLRSATVVPDLEDAREASRVLDHYAQLQDQIAAAKSLVGNLKAELQVVGSQHEQIHREVQDLLGDVGSCPICGH